MSLTKSNIDAAMNGEYTNFSNAVKSELKENYQIIHLLLNLKTIIIKSND